MKRKKPSRPAAPSLRTLLELQRTTLAQVDGLSEVARRVAVQLEDVQGAQRAAARAQRLVTVLLIGEYLIEPLRPRAELGAPRRPGWATERESEAQAPADDFTIVRGYMASSVYVQPGADEGTRIWLRDPGHRTWAPNAWLIALNGATLAHVRVGDMACGSEGAWPYSGQAPGAAVALLSHPIRPGVDVHATVRLEAQP